MSKYPLALALASARLQHPPSAAAAMASTTAATAPAKQMTDQEINMSYQRMKNELQGIATKIGELESESDEHALVLSTLLETLEKDGSRKCFRLVGGVLVERTVRDVVPALQTNNEGIKQVLKALIEQYQAREAEFEAFGKEHGISTSRVQRS